MTIFICLTNKKPGIFFIFGFLLSFVTILSTEVSAQDPFTTTWQVTAVDLDITIPTHPGQIYNYDVDWGDTTSDTGVTGNATHTYSSAGTYTVEITGDFPQIYFYNDGSPSDAEKILTVKQWGDIAWGSMGGAFYNAANLEINATDAPDLSSVGSMWCMFCNAISVNSDLSGWDVSNVDIMSSLFAGASAFNGDISTWTVTNVTDMSSMFLSAVAFNGNLSAWNVSNVTTMSFMFGQASAFNGDISGWDVSSVNDMSGMFAEATAFNQNIGAWNVSNVSNMSSMFDGASVFNHDISFKTINPGDPDEYEAWNVSGVTDMRLMFADASLFNQNIGNWNVSGVTDISGMFNNATVFDQDIGGWVVSSVSDMGFTFLDATAFNQDISGWNVSNVTNMADMFAFAGAFDQYLGGWDVSGVTDMTGMLDNSGLSTTNYDNTLTGWSGQTVQSGVPLGANGLEYCAETARQTLTDPPNSWTITGDALASGCSSTGFITTWEVTASDLGITIPTFPGETYNYNVDWGNGSTSSGVTGDAANTYSSAGIYTVEITGDFPRIYFNNGADKDKILTIEQWGDIEWSSMENAFFGASNLEINSTAGAPDLSGVNNLQGMFRDASSLNSDLNHWDVSGVTNMTFMFREASSMNSDLNLWDVSNVTDMSGMFVGATVFNGDITGWDVSNVTSTAAMFMGAISFNQDISGWNVGNVSNMNNMFGVATSFNQAIGGWDVSGVTDMTQMFRDGNFNQDISGWDVSNVTDMRAMFQNNSSFNQNLGGWDISNVTDMGGMLDNSGLSIENYDNALTGWAGQTVQSGVSLGATGLEYCNAGTERQMLIDAPNNWIITGDALASGCSISAGTDQRILASNQSTYTFSGGDFGIADAAFSVKIETLPGIGDLQFNGTPVSALDVISVADINDDKLTWDQSTDTHGYNYTSFDFRVVNGGGAESDPPNTLSIDLGAASVELTGGEGWRFMTSPAIGETLGGFLNPVWSQGVAGSNDPGASFPNVYRIDQPSYVWDIPRNMSDLIGIGEAFITFIYSDDNSDGTPDGFPKMLMSGEGWNPLDGTFEFTGLDYDTGQGPEGDSHYLIANPHPVSLDFCEMYNISTNVASSVDIWDPTANGGNGDYINLNCATPENVHIAPFQGFWVRTTDVSPDLDVPADAYLGSQANGYFKQPSKGSQPLEGYEEENPFLVTLTLSSHDQMFVNKTNLLFSEQAAAGLDEWDAPKLNPAGLANRWLSFYSLDEQNRAYAFQNMPGDFGEKVTIPLNVETTEPGGYNLNWSFPESHIFNGSYYLRDNVTGEVVELREGSSYSFEIEITEEEKAKNATLFSGSLSPTLPFSLSSAPRFELLIAQAGVDGMTELGAVPEQFTLAQNYPNPFNPTTVIRYQLPVNSEVRLEVYDMLGRRVAQLINGQVAAGRHTVNFDASGLSSGIYLYRLQAGSTIMTKKLTVVK